MGFDRTGSEGNSMGTKINILVVVAKANFYIRDTNLIRVGSITNDLQREHVAR